MQDIHSHTSEAAFNTAAISFSGLGVSGVALATSISMLLLIPGVKKLLPNFKILNYIKEFGKMILASAAAFWAAVAIRKLGINNAYLAFLLEGCSVVCMYLVAAWITKIQSLFSFRSLLKR